MEITLFDPHLGQRKVIEGFADSPHKFGVVVTSRQWGKSLLAQNLLLYWLLSNPGQKGCWIAPVYNQCRKVFQELTNAANQIISKQNKAELSIDFINGSTLTFLSSERPDSIRGFSFNYVIIDESAFVAENAINEAILPTLSAIGKKCLIISTPKSKNWFYTYYLKGLNEGGDYISFRGKSTDNPYISTTFIDEQRKSLPESIFRQEYEGEFSESTNDVFRNLDTIFIHNGWQEPQRNQRYYFGVDTGISNDFTVCAIIEESGRVVKIIRFNGKSITETGETICAELRKYSPKGGYCETNSIGQAIYEFIRSQNIKVSPLTTTQESKTRGIRRLINDIEEGVIELPRQDLMPEIYNELAAYTYKISANGNLSFSHPSGYHDDIVDALWLGNLARYELAFKKSNLYIGTPKVDMQTKVNWGL